MFPLYMNVSIPIVKIRTLTFAEQAVLALMIAFGLVLTILFGLFWFNPTNIPSNFSAYSYGIVIDFFIFVLLTYVVWHQIVNEIFVWIISLFMRNSKYVPAQ